MKKTFCDICNSETEYPYHISDIGDDPNRTWSLASGDLCSSCHNKLREFLKEDKLPDREVEELKEQVKELKHYERDFEKLDKKVMDLEGQLIQKDQIIKDLKQIKKLMSKVENESNTHLR